MASKLFISAKEVAKELEVSDSYLFISEFLVHISPCSNMIQHI